MGRKRLNFLLALTLLTNNLVIPAHAQTLSNTKQHNETVLTTTPSAINVTTGACINITTNSQITLRIDNLGEYVDLTEYGMDAFYLEDYESYITSISGQLNTEGKYNVTLKISNGYYEYYDKTITTSEYWEFPILALIPGKNELYLKFVDKQNNITEYSLTILSSNTTAEKLLRLPTEDTDGDNLVKYQELIYGTDENNPDTDNDGLTDYEEVFLCNTSPITYDTDGYGKPDSKKDDDKDGITALDEIKYGTSLIFVDTDGDGLSDKEEIYEYHTSPTEHDTDNDGLSDFVEVNEVISDPTNPDTDGDGILDGDESAAELMGITTYKDYTKPQLDERTLDYNQLKGSYVVQSIFSSDYNSNLRPHMYAGPLGYPTEIVLANSVDNATFIYPYDSDKKIEQPTLLKLNEEKGIYEVVPNQKVDTESEIITVENVEEGIYCAVDLVRFVNFIKDNQYKSLNNQIKNNINIVVYIERTKNVLYDERTKQFDDAIQNVIDYLDNLDDDSLNKVSINAIYNSSATAYTKLSDDYTLHKEKLNWLSTLTPSSSSGRLTDVLQKTYYMTEQDDKDREPFREELPFVPLSNGRGDIPDTETHVILLSDGRLSTDVIDVIWNRAKEANFIVDTVCAGLQEGQTVNGTKGAGTKPTVLEGIANEFNGKSFDISEVEQLEQYLISTIDEVTSRQGIDRDTDFDGLPDELEDNIVTAFGSIIRTDKGNRDSDCDGLLDGQELTLIKIPNYLDSTETPLTVAVQPNSLVLKADTDEDGILDNKEEKGRAYKWDVSDRHLAILSQLSYHTEKIHSNDTSRRPLIADIDNSDESKIDEAFNSLASIGEVHRVQMVATLDIPLTGFYCYVFKVDDNYIIANRGSEFNSFEDFLEDWIIQNLPAFIEVGVQDITALIAIQDILNFCNSDSKMTLTGHSLGGRLSLFEYYSAIKLGREDRIGNVVTFNGYGISNISMINEARQMISGTNYIPINILDIIFQLRVHESKIREYGIEDDFLTDGIVGFITLDFGNGGLIRLSSADEYCEECNSKGFLGHFKFICRHSLFHFFINDEFKYSI